MSVTFTVYKSGTTTAASNITDYNYDTKGTIIFFKSCDFRPSIDIIANQIILVGGGARGNDRNTGSGGIGLQGGGGGGEVYQTNNTFFLGKNNFINLTIADNSNSYSIGGSTIWPNLYTASGGITNYRYGGAAYGNSGTYTGYKGQNGSAVTFTYNSNTITTYFGGGGGGFVDGNLGQNGGNGGGGGSSNNSIYGGAGGNGINGGAGGQGPPRDSSASLKNVGGSGIILTNGAIQAGSNGTNYDGKGGTGGGANGGVCLSSPYGHGGNGAPNTGGGGGGSSAANLFSYGGSGIVILSFNTGITLSFPCFLKSSKILTNHGYIPIEDLKKGDLVKTLLHDFKPIDIIGKKEIYHVASKERIKNQLYQCSKDNYPELLEPLVLTGSHCLLIENSTSLVTAEQVEKIIQVNGAIYLTDDKLRLPTCVDEKTTVFPMEGNYTIYHLALENDDYYMNYGIYANGLLVETTSKRYLKELSGMDLS